CCEAAKLNIGLREGIDLEALRAATQADTLIVERKLHLHILKIVVGWCWHAISISPLTKRGSELLLFQNYCEAIGYLFSMMFSDADVERMVVSVSLFVGGTADQNQLKMMEYTLGHLKPEDKNKTLKAKVYRKWIARNAPKPTPIGYWCIVLHRQTMLAVFDQWEIWSFSDILIGGKSLEEMLISRIWKFDRGLVESMEGPVTIAVRSCRVSRYRDLQLLASPATHYYLNLDIPKTEGYRAEKNHDPIPSLEVCKHRLEDPDKERLRNRYSVTPRNPIRFTCPVTIASVAKLRAWYYTSCCECTRKVQDENDAWECVDHGPQPEPTYREETYISVSFQYLKQVDFTLDDVLDKAADDDETVELPEDFLVSRTPPSLELETLKDAGKTMVETRTIFAKRLILQNTSPEEKKKESYNIGSYFYRSRASA
ncbi:hypothetical protein Tco_1007735, partial [Tanacetum coccineum]